MPAASLLAYPVTWAFGPIVGQNVLCLEAPAFAALGRLLGRWRHDEYRDAPEGAQHGRAGASPCGGVTVAPLFDGRDPFFLAADEVQVKHEMLGACAVDGLSASEAARTHGYSRAAYYLVAASLAEAVMLGLQDERRGPRGPLKLSPETLPFIAAADPGLSGAALADAIGRRFSVSLHRRTVERARPR